MDADSSYGGSDTAQDSHSAHEHSTSLDHSHALDSSMDHSHHHGDKITLAVHHVPTPEIEIPNPLPVAVSKPFYHTNEVTVPVNMDEADFQHAREYKNAPHYLSTARIDVSESLEHHSNLEEMSRNYKSTNRLNESPCSERKYGGGVENPAFVGDNNVKSTFNSEKPYNGELNSLGVCSLNKTEDPMTEAVNLELINLKPGESNGGAGGADSYDVAGNGLTAIPVKKDNDRDIGGPFDEYFVPVNEHRKYMRGEKLYVTKDKRGEKGKSRCLCWGICLAIVAAAIIVGILAAVGIIGNQGPMPQEVSARNFDSSPKDVVKGGISIPGGESQVPEEPKPPYTPPPSMSTVSSMLPTTDTSMIEVPRALESELRISNLQFNPELADKNNSEYKALASALEEQIKNSLFSQEDIANGDSEIEIKIMEFTAGSVVVKYRIVWKPKKNMPITQDPIDKDALKSKMTDMLQANRNLIGQYYIEQSSIKSEKILDLCKIQNNGCEHICMFDYEIADFICTCPAGKTLASNRKNCIEDSEIPDFDFNNNHNEDFYHQDSEAPHHDDVYQNDHHSSEHSTHMHSTSKPDEDEHRHHMEQNYFGIVHETTHEPKPEPEPSSEHSPTEPKPEPEPTAEPEPSAHHEHPEDLEHKFVPTAEPEPKSEPTPEPEPKSEPEPTAAPLPKSEPEPTAEPLPKSEPEPTPEPVSKSDTEAITESQIKPEVVISSETEPKSEPEPTTEPEPKSEPEPTTKPELKLESEPKTEPEPTAEPEPKSEPEPTAEPEPKSEPEPTAEPEPKSQPEPTSNSESKSEQITTDVPEHKTEHVVAVAVESESKMEVPTTKSVPYLVLDNTDIEPKSENHNIETTTMSEGKSEEKPIVEIITEPKTMIMTDMVTEPKTMIMTEMVTESSVEGQITTMQTSAHPIQHEAEASTETHVHMVAMEDSKVDLTPSHNASSSETATSNPSTTEFIPVNNKSAEIYQGDFYYPSAVIIPTENKTVETEESTEVIANVTSDNTHEKMLLVDSGNNKLDQENKNETSTETSALIAEVMTNSYIVSVEQSTKATIDELKANSTDDKLMTPTAETTTAIPVTSSLASVSSTEDSIHNSSLSNEELINSTTSESNDIHQITLNHQSTEATVNQLNITEIHREPKIQDIRMEDIVHSNVAANSSESMSEEIMSPFLPELYNDTFINSLHSDDHYLEHNVISKDNDSHEVHTVTNPPSLEFDQMNRTNPHDNGTFDSLTIAPEGSINMATEPTSTTMSSDVAKNMTQEQTTPPGMTESSSKDSDQVNIEVGNAGDANPITNTVLVETTTARVVITTTTPEPETTLPLEIINNVHSNTFFDSLSKDIVETNKSTQIQNAPTTPKNLTETYSSTEDLIAMETTTNTHKASEDSNKVVEKNISDIVPKLMETTTMAMPDIKTEMPSTTNEITTVLDAKNAKEVITESPKSAEESNSSNDGIARIKTPKKEETTVAAEILETVTNVVTFKNPEDDNNIIESVEDFQRKQYEVKETTHDVTTTEKLFLAPKSTTELSVDEDLSVEPLHKEIKRHDSYDQFTSSETSNDIADDNDRPSKQTETVTYTKADSNDVLSYLAETNNFTAEESSKASSVKPVTEDFDLPKVMRCSVGQFQCLNGTAVKDGSYCIGISSRCDSLFDCSDGSDEINCTQEGCPNNFQCKTGQCLKRQLVCDGILNCNDGSDEENCDSWTCKFDEFSCGAGHKCIPLSWKCDGRSHCPNGSDEVNCPSTCGENSFRCSEQDSCIPNSWRCDGEADCKNAEDEKLCDCSIDQFKCQSGGGCIPKENRCDGIEQCADKSDERNCLKLDTLPNNTIGDKKILQVRSDNDTWSPICLDWANWGEFKYADLACRILGFSGSTSLESVPKPDDYQGSVYKLKNESTMKSSFLPLEKSDVAQCAQFATVSCHEYVCGNPSSMEVQSGRIIGGNKATPTQWPSLSLLYNKKSNVYCTTTLITPLWAIASYSCVEGNGQAITQQDWSLYAGGTPKADNASSQVREVEEIVPHPQVKFSQFEYVNDAVLIRLSVPVTININTSAICLSEMGVQPRQLCIIAGWGVSQPGEPVKHQYLHYLPVPMIDTDECNSTKHYNGKMASDKICAGYTDTEKTPCYNDEGAPLMCFSDTTYSWELQGLLSHHDNCGSNKHPAIFTAIEPKLKTWILNTVGEQGLVRRSSSES